jgi:GAF domain-containing protein
MDKEEQRLDVLRNFDILDTPPDDALDEIVKLAAELFDAPMAMVSIVERNRIWFKSKIGLTIQQMDREEGLCATAISGNDVYVVENARTDFRTFNHSLVKGSFGLQFYAAVPLITQEGYALGNLCILDTEPREFPEKDRRILKSLGKIVYNQMDLRLQARMVIKNQSELSYLLTHNLKSFTNNIPTLIEVLREMKHDAS